MILVLRIAVAAFAGAALALGATRATGSDFDQFRLFAGNAGPFPGNRVPPRSACTEHDDHPPVNALGATHSVRGFGDDSDNGLWGGANAGWSDPPPVSRSHALPEWTEADDAWVWQVLPDGLMYKSYLAGVREPRFSSAMLYEKRRGWVWDNTLGGRIGVLRHGSSGAVRPQGFQLDMEGAAITRLDVEHKDDLEAVDFRFGIPLTWRDGARSIKFGYYHVSSHVGDEFLLRNPDHDRVNYVRDALIFGISLELTSNTRTYAETAWGFKTTDGARPWEFQFGSEYSPTRSEGLRPVPYAAVNGHLREEHNFGGDLSLMAGWQWRGELSDRLWRLGFQYYNGKSIQYSFFDRHEQLTGLGLWFDY